MGDLDELVPTFLAALSELDAKLTDVSTRVEQLETKAKAASDGPDCPARLLINRTPVPPRGRRLRHAWADLANWVHWLTVTYEVDSRMLPPCWHLHGWLVRELASLRCAHSHALVRCKAEPRVMVTWHVDWSTFLTRVRASSIGDKCTISHQTAPTWRSDTPAVVCSAVFAMPDEHVDDGMGQVGEPPSGLLELRGHTA